MRFGKEVPAACVGRPSERFLREREGGREGGSVGWGCLAAPLSSDAFIYCYYCPRFLFSTAMSSCPDGGVTRPGER